MDGDLSQENRIRLIGRLFYLIEFCTKPAIGNKFLKTIPSPIVVSKAPDDP
jgi:hypothetical protein